MRVEYDFLVIFLSIIDISVRAKCASKEVMLMNIYLLLGIKYETCNSFELLENLES